MRLFRRRPDPIDGEALDLAVRRLRNPAAVVVKSELLPKVEVAEHELRKAWAVVSSRAVSSRLPIPKEAVAKEAAAGLALYSVTPRAVEQAFAAQGADWVSPFAPGRPLTPYVGYSGEPRTYDYTVGRNLNIEPRDGRIPFDVLRGVVESYDIATACIRYLIRDVRSLPLMFTGLDGASGPRIQKEITRARDFWRRPDGTLTWPEWVAKWLWDGFAYDCATLFKVRDNKGQVSGLRVIEGQTIMPLLNWLGDLIEPPGAAFQQVIMGVPWADFTKDDLVYTLFYPRPATPYGYPPIESVLSNATTDMRMQAFFLQFFTSGAVPELILSAPENATLDQIEQMQEMWDSLMQGDATKRFGARFVPAGVKPMDQPLPKFDRDLWEAIMRLTVSQYGLVPVNLGLTMDVNKATAGTQMDQQERNSVTPNIEVIEAVLNSVTQDDLDLEVEVRFDDARRKEDRLKEAQAYQLYIQCGMISPDRAAEKVLGVPVDQGKEAPRFVVAGNGVIPLTAIMATGGAIDPVTGAPTAVPSPEQFVWPGAQGPNPPGKALPAPEPVVALPKPNVPKPPQVPRQGWFEPSSVANVTPKTPTYRKAPGNATPAKKGLPAAAGLCLMAEDTKRVLLLKREPGIDDSEGGKWEFPGGHIEPGESSLAAAIREWEEEVGVPLPTATVQGIATMKPGYELWLLTTPVEAAVNLSVRVIPQDERSGNPEAKQWMSLEGFAKLSNVRSELAADRPAVVRRLAPLARAVSPEMDQFMRVSEAWYVRREKQWRPFVFRKHAAGDALNADLAGVVAKGDTHIRPTALGAEALAAERKFALRIRAALLRMIDRNSVVRAVEQARTEMGNTTSDEVIDVLARDAASKVDLDLRPIHDTLLDMAREATDAGYREAVSQLEEKVPEKSLNPPGLDLDYLRANLAQAAGPSDWDPSDQIAAALVHEDTLLRPLRAADTWGTEIDQTTRKYIEVAVRNGLREGSSSQEVGDAIEAQVGSLGRADLIATTEYNRYMTLASLVTYQRMGVSEVEFITAFDPCPVCAAIAADNPYPATDAAIDPPIHPRCVPGDVSVSVPWLVVPVDEAEGLASNPPSGGVGTVRKARRGSTAARAQAVAGRVSAGTKRQYVGEVVVLRTSLGHQLTVTPNHPVATPTGFVAAGQLHEGDDVLTYRGSDGRPDVEHTQALAHQVFEALPVVFPAVPTATEDFHGDGTEGEVHVVRTHGLLRDGLGEQGEESLLGSGDLPGSLDPERTATEEVRGLREPPARGVGGLGQALALLGSRSRHAGEHRLVAVPHGDAVFDEDTLYGAPADAEGFCERLSRLTGEVATAQIVSVGHRSFAGHVYNFTTTSGVYVANGLITHNCRCALAPL